MDAASVVVFTVGAFALWGFALWWAWVQGNDAWYYKWLLILLTLFWFFGESLAIRLGKYEYPGFPWFLRVPFPGLGTPQHPGPVENLILLLVPAGEGPPWKFDPACLAGSYAIPLPVLAIEAALVFGFFRLAASVLTVQKGRWRTPIATGALCAVLMVNAFAAFDPIVSTTMWCHMDTQPPAPTTYLPFGLWNWFTIKTAPGYWFGVPIVNFAAWFLAAAVFGFFARLDDKRRGGLVRKYKSWYGYVLATILILAIYIVSGIGLLLLLDRVLIHGQEFLFFQPIFTEQAWQIGWVVALLIGALRICWSAQRANPIKIEAVAAAPLLFTMVYCLWLLLRVFHLGIAALWLVTVVFTAIVLRWEFIAQSLFGDPIQQPAVPTPSGALAGSDVE